MNSSRGRAIAAIATAVLAIGILAGCGNDDPESSTPAPTTPQSTASNETPANPQQSDIVGDWRSDEADWTVHFHADGTFVEDFQGNDAVRSGEWKVEGTTVTLVGGDGNDDEGEFVDGTIVFMLGTLSPLT